MPDPLAFDDLFPPFETPTTADPAEPPAPVSPGGSPAGEAAPETAGASHSRAPLLAGLVVTLVILVFGGGLLWWRNRDSRYWPA